MSAARGSPEGKPAGQRARGSARTPRQGRGRAKAEASTTPDSESASGSLETGVLALARQVRGWADSVLGVAGIAADASLHVAKTMLPKPGQRAALERAGTLLRGMREAAGLSIKELGEAVDLKDPALLELVENGKVALPFEIILRLAGVLGRNDPISFVMRLTRSYNPEIWHTLENLGFGRLVVQAGREREFANLYRARDAARRLTDEEFKRLLQFMGSALDLALEFSGTAPALLPRKKATTGK